MSRTEEQHLLSGERLSDAFADLEQGCWLDTAHQGALPLAAAEAAREAIAWKVNPSLLKNSFFDEVPDRLRCALAALIGVDADDIILANSASYGLHLLAHGFPWRPGDEVVVAGGDFPSDILPWLLAERLYGIKVVQVQPA